jgi:hypothetical protein
MGWWRGERKPRAWRLVVDCTIVPVFTTSRQLQSNKKANPPNLLFIPSLSTLSQVGVPHVIADISLILPGRPHYPYITFEGQGSIPDPSKLKTGCLMPALEPSSRLFLQQCLETPAVVNPIYQELFPLSYFHDTTRALYSFPSRQLNIYPPPEWK